MHADKAYDVITVGAGPAGIAFARRLADVKPDAKVLLVDRDHHPRDKICGDGIDGAAQAQLEDIFPELTDRLAPVVAHSEITIWYSDSTVIRDTIPGTKIIPRLEFDAMLRETIADKPVDIVEGARVTDLLFDGDRVAGIKTIEDGEEVERYGKLVMASDGSRSLVRRKTGSTQDDIARVGVRQYVRGIPPPDDGILIFLDADHWGYSWIFPFQKDGEWWANTGWWPFGPAQAGPKERFHAFLEKPRVKEYLGGGELQGGTKGFPINTAFARKGKIELKRDLWGDGFLLLGDASGLVHPVSGGGIPLALYSGKLAADLYAKTPAIEQLGPAYQSEVLDYVNRTYELGVHRLIVQAPCSLRGPVRSAYFLFLRVLHWLDVITRPLRGRSTGRSLKIL